MICKNCGRETPDESNFCMWCAQPQIKFRRDPFGVRVPEPKLLPSGKWRIQLRKEGISITKDTADECREAARVERRKWQVDEAAGLHVPPPEKFLLKTATENYIASKSNILSPSTIKAYNSYAEHRFRSCMEWDINDSTLNWQMAINSELSDVSPKTVFNAWHLITASIKAAGKPIPEVSLPKVPKADRPWLSYSQIETFLDAIYEKPGELGALLALHSMRLSELLALKPENVSLSKEKLLVRGSRVLNNEGELIFKENNKTEKSRRDIPIVIPRLKVLLEEALPNASEYVYDDGRNKLYFQVNRICEKAGLPPVGVHGLRHSFASLAYHLGWKELSTVEVGGWKNSGIVRDIYTHNADLEKDIETMRGFYEGRE